MPLLPDLDKSPAPLPDNPCWGGPSPQQHSLEHLLNVLGETTAPQTSQSDYTSSIKRVCDKLVVFQDENYLVINKPPDLRMDGDYAASVHKLLLYLFPPPSLQVDTNENLEPSGECNNTMNCEDEKKSTTNRLQQHSELVQKIASLSKHSCLKDDPFRIVHQLDYATSGILLYAKTKRAAGTACRSFQERLTNKQYVAVIINSNPEVTSPPLDSDFFASLPTLPASSLKEWDDGSIEKNYRRKRRRETEDRVGKKDTFDGFMPVHSIFAKWRACLLRLKNGKDEKKQNNPRSRRKPNDLLPPLPEPETPLTSEEIDEVLSFGPSWKALKSNKAKHSRCWVSVVETMAREYNKTLAKFYARKNELEGGNDPDSKSDGQTKSASLPPLFRVPEKDSQHDHSFYICAAIGEPKDGRFEVIVDPSIAKTTVPNDANDKKDTNLPEMRPSLTKCTVLWRGLLQTTDGNTSVSVAKVLLQPLTGRRHQLRVHLAQVAGFPILGDVTYGGNIKIGSSKVGSSEVVDDHVNDTRVACHRMCLHAKQLAIPLLEGDVKTFEASDPFRIVKKVDCQEEMLEVAL